MNSNPTSSASSATSNRPPFHISRASDEITQFPSYETMHQLSTSPNHKSYQSTSASLFMLTNHQTNSTQPSLSGSTNDPLEQATVTRRVSGAIDFFTSLVPGLSSPRSNYHQHYHTQPNHTIYNSDQEEGRHDVYDRTHHENPTDQDTDDQTTDPKLSRIQFLSLTLNLLSCNLVWTILIYYGMPFILKLDLSTYSTTWLWLSSPISGLIIPPLIGIISDLNSKSLHRRRTWIVISTLILLISLISLSFCTPLGIFMNYLIGGDQGDWDPKKNINIHSNSILIAIVSFYFSFFSLDCLILSTRSLILDQISSYHQNSINVWSSRMLLLGQLIGFGIATFSNSNHGPEEPQLLRELVGYSILLLIITSSLICTTQIEHPITSKPSSSRLNSTSSNLPSFKDLLEFYKTFLNTLPIPIKRVCYVQVFNSICWITILYHSKSLISNFILYELSSTGTNLTESLIRYSERQGTITMLKFSLISLIFSFLLPFLCKFGTTDYVIHQRGKRWTTYRRMLRFLTPRNLWSFSFVVYLVLMGFTFGIESSSGASRLIILLGFSWSITQWVPFALLMEYTRSIEETPPVNQFNQTPISSPSGTRRIANTPPSNVSHKIENRRINERSQLINNPLNEIPLNLIKTNYSIATKTGGSILAIHQLSTVAPHFLISIITSMMFNIVYLLTNPTEETNEPINLSIDIQKPTEVLWFFRFTSIFALISLILSRKIVLPTSELEYWDELNYQIYETERFRNGEVLQEDRD
ncbi:uncharacterized protein MELLADRAFT_116801 [Melampsora larici-populina 98AG31]|uniref:Sucrose transporter n=1 Tax=Melampsora larici-populina (strain 98AG31 / pathotype 3-4-7) TaxID=747676 RepID=F4RQL8_MELLP|nr:uncharacterized protein MELLADRAFT_116801 [Melampsora larici-populina 98AG31]EGG05492.1 hypothetical protein MELLADRAFT_116801 [Melampsora larici-populina 98AG31]